ncbi:cyclodeaminase/cyclohydrolase family protein [Paenibacillus humicola]|uniref:cyclodeaminase/cyclohydrolase family protein n=1 Tax=Paenibacillus humicola TaxID=3110540 RepID=UPI00237A6B23|nr:cyclodeaminase/cyclohydrolase family protein [Paenibacillus humicola]
MSDTKAASEFDWTVRTFLQEAASSSPTPGGGSVAALAAALAASMGSMVARLTSGPKYEGAQETAQRIARDMSQAIVRCEALSAADIAAFGGYMQALGLPRSTEADKQTRKAAIAAAALTATEAPMALIDLCRQMLEALEEAAQLVNRNAISDWGIAALLAESAAQSAWLTALINLPSLADASAAANFRKRGEEQVAACVRLKDAVVSAVKGRLAL